MYTTTAQLFKLMTNYLSCEYWDTIFYQNIFSVICDTQNALYHGSQFICEYFMVLYNKGNDTPTI